MAGPSNSAGSISVSCKPVTTPLASDTQGVATLGVIIVQTCKAAWQAMGGQMNGSCNDGLGDSEVDTTINTPFPGYMTTGVSQGTHYSAKSQSATDDATCSNSPSASAGSGGLAYETVNYTAQVIPVSIVLTGISKSSTGPQVLCGQMCSASVPLPAGYTCTRYGWTISDSNAQSWGFNANGLPVLTSTSGRTPKTGSGPWTGTIPGPSWYWYDTTVSK